MKRKSFASLAIAVVLLCAIVVQYMYDGPVVAQSQAGPRIDTVRHKVTRSPAAQLVEMTSGPPVGSDMWMGMIRPTDVEAMDAQGKTLSSRSMLQFCEFGFNYRSVPLDDVNFRHALAHLVPKEKIIGTLLKYIGIAVSSPVPPAQGLWYNPNVDPQPYSQAEAEAILTAGGYQKIGGEWKMPDGSDMPPLRVYVPLEIVAPIPYTIGTMFIGECEAVGLTNINLESMDYSTYMSLVFDEWDFDIFWTCWRLDRGPTHLYSFFHSSNNFQGSQNPYGISYPALDAEIETFYFGLDHAAKVAAAKQAQELLMGGTTIDPLAIPAQPERSQAIPIVPVYSRNALDAQQPDLRGAVNMHGYGIDNIWTYMNIHWNTPDEYRPGTNERMVVPILDGFPETLNPTSASTPYAWKMMDPVFDGLVATNPYTHGDEPWLATSWSYVAVPEGMDVTFNLRLTNSQGQPITWHDGTEISVNDVEFAWDFLYDWQIPKYWEIFRYYDPANTVIVDSDTIRARVTTTSQWIGYSLAGAAYMLPPQVWANNPVTGNPWTSTTEILAFDPTVHAGPGGLPTMLYGTGPFILQHSTTFIGVNGYGDLTANRNYWLTTAEIQDTIGDMFHRAGDVNYDGVVDVEDIAAVGLAWLTTPGDPLWNPDADITGPGGGPPDSVVDIFDIAMAGKSFGETRTVPDGFVGGPQAPTPVVYVDPPLVTGVFPGETFSVDIRIHEAIDLYVWQLELSYSPQVLSVIDVSEGDFLMTSGSTFFTAREWAYGQYRVGCTFTGSWPGADGDGILATVVFMVSEEGESPIDLGKTKLLGSDLGLIGCTAQDGYYRTYAAKVLVDPVTIVGSPPRIGETFTVDVEVADVGDLYTWQAGLTFNATVCEALDISEGEFLKRAGVTTLWTPGAINNVQGEISYSACSLTGPTPGVSGNGQLMNVTFRVKEIGDVALNLTDVLLLNSSLTSIEPIEILWDSPARILNVGLNPSSRTEYLYVDSFTPLWTQWTTVGTSPWLNAAGDGNYIQGDYHCELMGVFDFQNITLGPFERVNSVTLEGHTRADDTNIDIDVYVFDTFYWLGSLWGETTWSWKSPRWETNPVSTLVPSTKTEAGLNNFSVLVHYYSPEGTTLGNADLDALRLKVNTESLEPIDTKEVYPTWTVPLNIGVVVENQETATKTFDVTIYANTTAIGTKSVTLAAGANTTVAFNWNLAGFPEGTYTISAVAANGEIGTPDCVFISGTVKVKHPGDANDDDVVNAYDLGLLGQAWGTQVGDPLYDPRVDFNGDGVIDNQDHDILKDHWP